MKAQKAAYWYAMGVLTAGDREKLDNDVHDAADEFAALFVGAHGEETPPAASLALEFSAWREQLVDDAQWGYYAWERRVVESK